MTCADQTVTFRLLDPWVGWQPDSDAPGLAGLKDQGGLRLDTVTGGLLRDDLLPWFGDPRLAPACRTGWYRLQTSAGGPRLFRRDPCTGDWPAVWTPDCDPGLLREPVAVAAGGHWLAVVDSGRVLLWDREGEHLAAVTDVPGARLAAVSRHGDLLAGGADGTVLWRFGPDGTLCGRIQTGVTGRLLGIRVGAGGTAWLLTQDGDGGPVRLWTGRPGGAFTATDPAALAAALPASDLVAAWPGGFCLRLCGPDGEPADECTTWSGAPLPGGPPRTPRYRDAAGLTTEWLDSGISRCRWHRVRLDAEVQAGGTLEVAVAVAEDPDAAVDPADWQQAPPGVLDFLVDQPPGRRLKLRLTLGGDGDTTPVVHRIRLDLPRSTSADLLPAAFRQDPVAEDFTERFLSLFDSSLADLDRVIERYPALLDPDGVPDGVLTWLGGLLGLSFEAGWGPGVRRALLAGSPGLYRARGTPAALAKVIEIVTGLAPDIEELASERLWATVSAAGAAPGDPAAAGQPAGPGPAVRAGLGTAAAGRRERRGRRAAGPDPAARGRRPERRRGVSARLPVPGQPAAARSVPGRRAGARRAGHPAGASAHRGHRPQRRPRPGGGRLVGGGGGHRAGAAAGAGARPGHGRGPVPAGPAGTFERGAAGTKGAAGRNPGQARDGDRRADAGLVRKREDLR